MDAAKKQDQVLQKIDQATPPPVQDVSENMSDIEKTVVDEQYPVAHDSLGAPKRKMSAIEDLPLGSLLLDNDTSLTKKVKVTTAGTSLDGVSEVDGEGRNEIKKGKLWGPTKRMKFSNQDKSANKGEDPLKSIETGKQPKEFYSNDKLTQPFDQEDLQTLSDFISIIDKYKVAKQDGEDTKAIESQLRNKVHDMEFYKFLSAVVIKESKLMEPHGLPQVSNPLNDKDLFPFDLVADCKALETRWKEGNFDPSLFRGVRSTLPTMSNGIPRLSHAVEQGYTFKKSAKVFGENSLVNGQWWPLRLCAVRDGAHGDYVAGVYGETAEGAYSVVVGKGKYRNTDNGMTLVYCGTESSTTNPTDSTKLLQSSMTTRMPIRVLRAANSTSKYAPNQGIRYDGLYEVTGQKLHKAETALYYFTLTRLQNQDPIRWGNPEDSPEARPSKSELTEHRRITHIIKEANPTKKSAKSKNPPKATEPEKPAEVTEPAKVTEPADLAEVIEPVKVAKPAKVAKVAKIAKGVEGAKDVMDAK